MLHPSSSSRHIVVRVVLPSKHDKTRKAADEGIIAELSCAIVALTLSFVFAGGVYPLILCLRYMTTAVRRTTSGVSR